MTDVTLTVNGVTFTFADGSVKSIDTDISSSVQNTPQSAAGPMTGYNYDQDGCVKRIVLNGVLFTADSTRTSTGTVTTILSQKQWLESLINGNQKGITFTSNYDSQSILNDAGASSPYQGSFTTTKVKVEQFTTKEMVGNPNEITFILRLVVGNSTT